MTFRAGGTSLNGQGQTDGILIDVRRHWTGVEVEQDGARVAREARARCSAGRTPRSLPYSRRIGPDPASTDIACVGGVIANNSGGMRCGVVHDAYQTLRAMKLVLPSGTVIDTEAARRRGALRRRPSPSCAAACSRSATRSAPTRS